MAKRKPTFTLTGSGDNNEVTGAPGGDAGSENNGAGNETGGLGNLSGSNTDGVDGGGNTAGNDPNAAAPPVAPAAKAEGRKRGRPPGSKNGTTSSSKKGTVGVDEKTLAKQVQGVHVMLAMLTQQPIFQLSDNEAEMMAGALANVSRHYNVTLDGPRAAVFQLIAVGGMIYLPRILAVRNQNLARQPQRPSAPQTPQESASVPHDGTIDFTGERTFRQEAA